MVSAAGFFVALLALSSVLPTHSSPVSFEGSLIQNGCPEPRAKELVEYKAFHAAKRLAPDAKYLVFYCPPQGCAGVGKRHRGSISSIVSKS